MSRIDDGHPTLIQFEDPNSGDSIGGDSTVTMSVIWEKRVTPPGMQGGGANDVTTMRNQRWRSVNAKKLLTLSEMTCTVSYDPAVYEQLVNLIQINGIVTVYFPDGSFLQFYGFIDEFTPGENAEGSPPEATLKIIPTNTDPESFNEVAPTYTAP